MTISNRVLNDRLGDLENCATQAPEGTYEDVKTIVTMMDGIMDTIESEFKAAGLEAGGCDSARNLHVALYAYLIEQNPDHGGLAVGEGFGKYVDGMRAHGRDLAAEAARNRDALRALVHNYEAPWR